MKRRRNRNMKLEDAADEYTEFVGTPSYRKNVYSMFNRAGPFLEDRRVTTVGDITVRDCRELAKHLKRCALDGEISKRTANNYYRTFRSWLEFCVRDEMIDDNPAAKRRAEEPLPEPNKETVQQFWSQEDREDILDAADDQAAEAIEEIEESGWAPSFRNRGVVYVLSYSGSRLTETLASSEDEARNGICWSDVDLEEGAIRVFGKNREYESMQLPSPAAAVLEEYKEIVAPASEKWPVFPSNSTVALRATAREQLADRGLDEDEREDLLAGGNFCEVLREEALTPPPLTASGFRRAFWYDFVEEYDLFIDGDMPEFHAARRGLGDELYRENPRLAQSALRHSDLQTTHNNYSHIQASETSDEVDEMMDADQPREFLQDDEDGEDGEAGASD